MGYVIAIGAGFVAGVVATLLVARRNRKKQALINAGIDLAARRL